MACFFVSRHVLLEHLIDHKPLNSEECMLVYKVSKFYINILTMLIKNRTLLQVSQVYDKILFLKKPRMNSFHFRALASLLPTCTTKSLKKRKEVFSGFVCT